MAHAIVIKSRRYPAGWEILHGHECRTVKEMRAYSKKKIWWFCQSSETTVRH
jgi:hypothetical protein